MKPQLVPVVTLPDGKSVRSPGVRMESSHVDQRLRAALPGARIASYSSTGSDDFVSNDGRTAFAFVFPRAGPNSTFGENSAGGGNLKAFYQKNHILAGDAFWVSVRPMPTTPPTPTPCQKPAQ